MVRLFVFCIVAACGVASADTTVCINGRCGLRQPTVVVQNVVTAQEHAERLAATGGFSHCTNRGGGYEGLGFSTSSPRHACESACYWGRRRVREIGTAWCANRRGWVAVIRYE